MRVAPRTSPIVTRSRSERPVIVRGARPAVPDGPYLVAGAGRAGQAAAAALAAHAGPAQVTVWPGESGLLAAGARERLAALGVTILGTARGPAAAATERAACVVVSPGMPPEDPVLRAALEAGRPVLDELDLGWRLTQRAVVGVTGTNGKSTVAELLRLLVGAGPAAEGIAGNTEFGPPLSALGGDATRPAIVEASSYQLERCPAFLPDAAVLTCVGHDHQDRHPDPADYEACKRRMLMRGPRAVPAAAIGIDDPAGRRAAVDVAARAGRVLTFGAHPEADVRLAGTGDDGVLVVATPREPVRVDADLPGPYARCAPAAVALGLLLGASPAVLEERLRGALLPPCRYERFALAGGARLVVDHAHNADGVRDVLVALRDTAGSGRVIAMVGASRRYAGAHARELGRVMRHHADVPILTGVARRLDGADAAADPELVAEAGPDAVVVDDRAVAIERALGLARSGDVVVILGGGAMPSVPRNPRIRIMRSDLEVLAALGVC